MASYGVGGHFYLHHDPMFIYKEPGFHATSVETRGDDSYITGTVTPPPPPPPKKKTYNFSPEMKVLEKIIVALFTIK